MKRRVLSRLDHVDVATGRESRTAGDELMQIDRYYVEHPHARRTYASLDEVATALLTRGTGLIGAVDDRGGERTLTASELHDLGRAIGETRRRMRSAAARALLAPAGP
jgi:hypothetical protein